MSGHESQIVIYLPRVRVPGTALLSLLSQELRLKLPQRRIQRYRNCHTEFANEPKEFNWQKLTLHCNMISPKTTINTEIESAVFDSAISSDFCELFVITNKKAYCILHLATKTARNDANITIEPTPFVSWGTGAKRINRLSASPDRAVMEHRRGKECVSVESGSGNPKYTASHSAAPSVSVIRQSTHFT